MQLHMSELSFELRSEPLKVTLKRGKNTFGLLVDIFKLRLNEHKSARSGTNEDE